MTTNTQKPPTLSRRMREVLAEDGPPFGRPRAKARELVAIKHALKRRGKDHPALSIGKLMRVAVDADPSSETARLVATVLTDSKLDASTRRKAAYLLSDMPFAAARNALAKQLGSGEQDFEPTILNALAKIGDAKSAESIRKLPKTNSVTLKRMRDFVLTVIAYRTGDRVSRTKEYALIPRSIPMLIEPEAPAKVASAQARLRGSSYGLKLKHDLGFCFDCGGTKHVMLVNDELRRGHLTIDLLAKRRIAGLIAMEEPDSNDFVTRHLIFIKPARGKAVISITNPAGEVVMMGKLQKSRTGLELEMRDHTHSRFPINVSGLITDSEVLVGGELYPGSAHEKDSGDVDTSMYTD